MRWRRTALHSDQPAEMKGPRIAGADGPFQRPGALVKRHGKINLIGELTYRAHLIKSVHARNAGKAVPVIGPALAPPIDPGLSGGGAIKGASILGFTMNTMLITAQKCSFHRITLESSHKVEPSFEVQTRLAVCEARSKVHRVVLRHRGDLPMSSPPNRFSRTQELLLYPTDCRHPKIDLAYLGCPLAGYAITRPSFCHCVLEIN